MVSLILIEFTVGNKRIVPAEKHKAVVLEAGDGFDIANSPCFGQAEFSGEVFTLK
jgi:hypothetical protein